MLDHVPAESPAPWSSTSVGPAPPVQTFCGPIEQGTAAWKRPAPASARLFMSAYTESGRFQRYQNPLASTMQKNGGCGDAEARSESHRLLLLAA